MADSPDEIASGSGSMPPMPGLSGEAFSTVDTTAAAGAVGAKMEMNGANGTGGPSSPSSGSLPKDRFIPLVSVVDFHHARGPEVESWFGVDDSFDPAIEYEWPLLPFMALSDGAHASEEDFSYFTLLLPSRDPTVRPTSLFGIACTRQLDASQLINRPADVTRSTVQKAVVVIADSPQSFGLLRTRLSFVTSAWFAQREFTDTEILRRFQESLAESTRSGTLDADTALDQNLGMSLRELVREFKWQTLVLLKCCLLQRKMLFFGSKCDRLCMVQFSLISLIPGLIRHLQDCADPDLNSYEATRRRSTSLRTSDRTSLLTYMGLPLQIFGKGSLFGPYTPLQQLDVLADVGTKSYIVGSTNSLLLQQKDRYSDILINLDDNTINISSVSLRNALVLTTPDRRWIDYITSTVNDTWDEANPSRPSTHKYIGSEDFIRTQFEEYILALVAAVKYQKFAEANPNNPTLLLQDVEGNPALEFGQEFIEAWERTENYQLWYKHTDSHIFDICEPKHPAAGGLTIEDVQRRIAEQVKELHLDEKFAQGREVLGRNLAAGREKAASVINKLYADMESRRQMPARGLEPAATLTGGDMTKTGQPAQTVGSRAGAYMSSWAAWAGEKKKQAGWGAGGQPSRSKGSSGGGSGGGGGGGGWGWGYGKKSNRDSMGYGDRDYQIVNSPGSRLSVSSLASTAPDDDDAARRLTIGSRGSLFSAGSIPASIPASPMRRPDSSRSDVSSLHGGHGTTEPAAATVPKVATIKEDKEKEREEEDKEDEDSEDDSDGESEKPKPAELLELEQSVWDSPVQTSQTRFDHFHRPDDGFADVSVSGK